LAIDRLVETRLLTQKRASLAMIWFGITVVDRWPSLAPSGGAVFATLALC